jgi:putative transposase
LPNSYSSLWVHLIWSTKNREPILSQPLKSEVFRVINEIANDYEIFIDAINGIEDHIHLLVRLRTDQALADVVKIKGNSWEYFKNDSDNYVTWQDGFAAFSVSPDNLARVRSYIYNQEKHHHQKSFSDELKEMKQGSKSQ